MEFIKNFFKKIKDFFTIHSRVENIEMRLDIIREILYELKRKIEVLEFKEEAKGEKYTFTAYKRAPNSIKHWLVSFINGNHVVSVCTEEMLRYKGYPPVPVEPVINGDYIEFYREGTLESVYTPHEDDLIRVDINLYKKANPEKFASKIASFGVITSSVVDMNDPLISTTDAISDLTAAVEKLQKSGTKPKKTKKKETTNA